MSDATLIILLRAVAEGQFIIAVLGMLIGKILRWEDEIARMNLLVREVFQIHKVFLSYTLTFFAVLTWRFAPEIAAGQNPFATWTCGGIALFWGIRTVFQWTFYSHEHWRGKGRETAVHWTLTTVYGSWCALYIIGTLR